MPIARTLLAASLGAVAACSDDDPTPGPAGDAGPDATTVDASAAGSVGPVCTALMACCDEMDPAAQNAPACDLTRTILDDAQRKGTAAELEGSCENALRSARSATKVAAQRDQGGGADGARPGARAGAADRAHR
jgi:hypothetical protein